MQRLIEKILVVGLIALNLTCTRHHTNIEAELVKQVVSEFAAERFAHYLHGGAPKTNREILEKVLSRHSVRFHEFSPALRRFEPAVAEKILGKIQN